MSKKNIQEMMELDHIEVSEEELPRVVSECLDEIDVFDRHIQEASACCEKSRERASQMVHDKGMNHKEAINSTQDAVKSLAEAQQSLSEAQKILFDYQQKVAKGMQFLLMLGASNIAMNRIVIVELETKLKQASQGKLSEKTREELIEVIRLLREQESAFSKQDRMSDQIKSHGREIESIHRVDAIQDETDKKHDSMIAENANKNQEQDHEILRQQRVDRAHDEQLRQTKILAWVGVGMSALALVLSLIAILL